MADRRAKMASLASYDTYLEIDYSRFDKTIDQPIIVDVEMAIMEMMFPRSEHPLFWEAASLLPWTSGRSVVGLAYLIAGTRVSGDAHTSVFNLILNKFFSWLVLEPTPKTSIEHHSFQEGDDGLIGFYGRDRAQVQFNITFLVFLGLVVKAKISDLIEDTTFCGRQYTFAPTGLIDMCDLPRTLAKFHITCTGLSARRAAVAKAYSYWAMDSATPIVGTLCYVILKLYASKWDEQHILRSRALNLYERERIVRGFGIPIVYVAPTPEARALVAYRHGFSTSLQASVEQTLLADLRSGHLRDRMPMLERDDLVCDSDRATIQQQCGRYYG